jgi:LysR family transcriptional regulator, glycine cleavage system transcriptional activator
MRLMVRDSLPPLVSVRAFEAAARLGSFADAARELGTTAASISYHVRQLERYSGLAMFRRHPHKVELTPVGATVASEATDAFARLRASFERASEYDEVMLRITTLPTIGTSWLTPRLGRFRALHPSIALEIDLSVEAHDLGLGGFDIAIRNGHGSWPGLRTSFMFPSIFQPLCSPSLGVRCDHIEDPSALGVPLLGRPDWWSIWYRQRGLEDNLQLSLFATRLSAEHLDVAAAIAGHGVAIASPILFAAEIAAGRLVAVHSHIGTDGRSFWFTYPVKRERSKKVKTFARWLTQEVADARAESVSALPPLAQLWKAR